MVLHMEFINTQGPSGAWVSGGSRISHLEQGAWEQHLPRLSKPRAVFPEDGHPCKGLGLKGCLVGPVLCGDPGPMSAGSTALTPITSPAPGSY